MAGYGNNNNNNRISYFAEERTRNNNPQFYVKMDDIALRRQVRRICQDIKNCLIVEQDLVYFTNDKIISACISVAKEEWLNAVVSAEALNSYLTVNFNSYSSVIYPYDIAQKRVIAASQLNKMHIKANTWKLYYDVFQAIQNGSKEFGQLFGLIAQQNFNPRNDL